MPDGKVMVLEGLAVGPSEWERALVVGLPPLRAARGWSQSLLARRSGLHRRTISRLERPEPNTSRPNPQTLTALARAFGYVHLSDLWTALQGSRALDMGAPLIVAR